MVTKYGVFIIESLREGDFFDGENLSQILELSQIPSVYREVVSRSDFRCALEEFHKSGLRYLHLSCHADFNGIEINGEEISLGDLTSLFNKVIKGKRLFLSACKGSNRHFASAIIAKNEGQSVIGTPIDLYFNKAALFWPSFYHVINNIDKSKMNRESLSLSLKRCVDLFEVPINYYHKINGEDKYLRRHKFRSDKPTVNRKISAIDMKFY